MKKMTGADLVNNIINTEKPQEILDLKCRKWYFSLLASSYGAHVEVVDDPKNPEFPDFLKFHPNITYNCSEVTEFEIKKKYDMIIMKHIAISYEREFFLGTLMPEVHNHLTSWGIAFVTFHFPDSYVMKCHPEYFQYSIDDFGDLKENFILKDFWEYHKEVPYTVEFEHIGYVVLQKR